MTSSDPTRTAGIERRWNREITKRWTAFNRVITKRLRGSGYVTNAFDMSAEQIRIFMAFWQAQVDAMLLGTDEAPNWQAKYQTQSYQRAIERGRAQLIAQGAQIAPTVEELLQAADIDLSFTAVPSLGIADVSVVGPQIHQEALEFLHTRSYEALKNWTSRMTMETRQILTDGVREGKGINELKREIMARVDVSASRARTIARTETTEAYRRASIIQAEQLAEETGEDVNLRWLTVGDGRVRHLHAGWHGQIMTPNQAFKNSSKSPFNCRCALAPIIPEADTPAKKKKFDKERKAMLLIERK